MLPIVALTQAHDIFIFLLLVIVASLKFICEDYYEKPNM